MRNILVFTLSLSTALAGVALACSAPPTPEPINSPNRGSSGSSGSRGSSGEDGSSGTSGSTSASVDCSNRASVDDRPACDSCAKSKCCKEIKQCDDTADCAAIQKCLGDCGNDDETCQLTCLIAHPKGQEVLGELASCITQNCKSECPSSMSGSDAGDPF